MGNGRFGHSQTAKMPGDTAKAHAAKQDTRINAFSEIGTTGLKRSGGFIQEEFRRELQGQDGARIYSEMLHNSALIAASFYAAKQLMRRAEWRWEPFEEDNREDQQRADFMQECMDDMSASWPDTLTEVLTMLPYGYSPMEVVYKKREGMKSDGASKYTDGLIGWRKMALRAQESIESWEFDEAGGVRGLYQVAAPQYRRVFIPIDKLLLFRTEVEKGNPEGASWLRPAYWDYYIVQRMVELSAIGVERDISGIPKISVPGEHLNAEADAASATVVNAYKNIGENIRNDEQAYVMIPSDTYPDTNVRQFDIELISAAGQKQYDIKALIERHEQRICMALGLADWLLVGHEGVGSRALVDPKMDIFSMSLESTMDSVAEVINRHGVPRLFALNGWPADRPATLKHGSVAKSDVERTAKLLDALVKGGADVFPDEVLTRYFYAQAEWPIEGRDELLKLKKEERANATKNPQGDQDNSGEADAEDQTESEVEDDQAAVGKDNPNHVPAGSPEGGQFASAGGGAETSSEDYSSNEKSAIEVYQGGSYKQINNYLRNGGDISEGMKTNIRNLDSAIDRSRLPSETTLWRGIEHEALNRNAEKLIGREINSAAFVSTSTSRRTAEVFGRGGKGVLFKITAAKGARALNVANALRRQTQRTSAEREHILPRGAKFNVTGVNRDGPTPIISMVYS